VSYNAWEKEELRKLKRLLKKSPIKYKIVDFRPHFQVRSDSAIRAMINKIRIEEFKEIIKKSKN
jgi:hypothetical protein